MKKAKTREIAAGFVLFVIAVDLLVFVVAGVASSLRVEVPAGSLSFLAVTNGAAWALALMDDGRGL